MNSREKGKRGERQWRDELRVNGFEARRGQQFSGSAESPDVVCAELDWIHFEVKCVERLNIENAMRQARRDALTHGKHRTSNNELRTSNTKIPVVAHKRNFSTWLVTMDAETFFRLLRGDFATEAQSEEKDLGVSRKAHDTAAEAAALPKTAENNKQSERN